MAELHYLQVTQKPLIGMSDASLKDGQCSHACVLSSSDLDHLTNRNMSIHGAGAVDGDITTMSSTKGELHGQTAVAIMSKKFLNAHNVSVEIYLL
jgi:hypothetical protein